MLDSETAAQTTHPPSALDPRVIAATSMHAQPGVYALLLGSGTSTGAGVPTGWGVVTELVRRVAAASDAPGRGADGTSSAPSAPAAGDLSTIGDATPAEQVDDPDRCLDPARADFDAEAWWEAKRAGQDLGYSSLLSELASTPAARRALLSGFFEPTVEDREEQLKVPGSAHRAIAALVARGTVRVILTTNFDRLIEQALEAEGIFPQVIASPAAIEGMEPLTHARCTVIKLHGDYARIDQLNTLEELSTYDPALRGILERVLDEYGLLINGWSGDWDHALVDALQGTRSRRYPLFWATYGELGHAAKGLAAQHRAHVIGGAAADTFFPDLVARLEALDSLTATPLSRAMAVARLKRLLPVPARHIELRDLFDVELTRLRELLATRGSILPAQDPQFLEQAHDDLREWVDPLLHLYAHGIYLDRDRQHGDLWVWVLEQLMRARPPVGNGTFNEFWVKLAHYPAALALKAGSLAAVAAGHDDIMLRLLREPTWRSPWGDRQPEAALGVLHDYTVLDHDAINSFPRWGGAGWLYARSHLFKEELRPVLLPLLGDDDTYQQLFNRVEYRTALAQAIASSPGWLHSAPGEFVGDWQWDREHCLIWEKDFRDHADREAWGWAPVDEGAEDAFDALLTRLSEELAKARRFG